MEKIGYCICIDAPHFSAAVISDDDGIIIDGAPIVKYMIGWTYEAVQRYCNKKGWKIVS